MTKVEKLVLFFKVVVGSVITGIAHIPHPPALVADTHKFFSALPYRQLPCSKTD
jgi:hypothetical protein